MSRLRAFLGLTLACCALSACAGESAIMLEVASDLPTPSAETELRIAVSQNGSLIFDISSRLDRTPDEGGLSLPATLVLAEADTAPPVKGTIAPGIVPLHDDGPLQITLSIEKGDDVELERTAVVEPQSAALKKLRMDLESDCLGVACGSGQTCQGAKCVSNVVDAASLPDL